MVRCWAPRTGLEERTRLGFCFASDWDRSRSILGCGNESCQKTRLLRIAAARAWGSVMMWISISSRKGKSFLKYSGLRSYFHSDDVGGSLSRNGPVPMTVVFKAFTGFLPAMCLGMVTLLSIAQSGNSNPDGPLP